MVQVNDSITIPEGGGAFYMKANAVVVSSPSDMPREMASEFSDRELNPSFVWVAGRYVQANVANKNGHFWTLEDLQAGQSSIKYVPMNVGHDFVNPVGVFVETKLMDRQVAGTSNPEIQALGAIWAANFPEVAAEVKKAHAAKQLFLSMECVSEKKQCLQCDQVFAYASKETCEHLQDARAPRRFINPVFLGGALVLPPMSPAWPDAEVTEVSALAQQDPEVWEEMMSRVLESVK